MVWFQAGGAGGGPRGMAVWTVGWASFSQTRCLPARDPVQLFHRHPTSQGAKRKQALTVVYDDIL